MLDLGQIKLLRKALGITQHVLAKKAEVSQSIIAKIESSSIDPTYSKVCKIFEALDRLQKQEELLRDNKVGFYNTAFNMIRDSHFLQKAAKNIY